jgi:hypothetical protein
MSDFKNLVYILENNLDRSNYLRSGEGYDIQAFSFDKVMEVRRAEENKVLDLLALTFFYKCHDDDRYIKKLDSLQALEGCPIFSQRMIDVILSVRDFEYRKYPIAIIESRHHNPYEDVDKYKKLSLRDDLFIFQPLVYLDVFDWERSDFDQDEYDKDLNVPTYIREFVLKEPNGGFPPLFRLLPLQSMNLFISREAREELRNAEIVGPSFTPLSRPSGNSEIDISINEARSAELTRESDKHQRRIDRVFTRAEEERAKGNDSLADRLEQEAHDLMRMSG